MQLLSTFGLCSCLLGRRVLTTNSVLEKEPNKERNKHPLAVADCFGFFSFLKETEQKRVKVAKRIIYLLKKGEKREIDRACATAMQLELTESGARQLASKPTSPRLFWEGELKKEWWTNNITIIISLRGINKI